MVRITPELVRKRAEHNDGDLATLREVALHQYDIEKIENLAQISRHLEILYLQNNLIGKIENLGKLKELEYLNLAVNNITRIENLEGCESLRKIDLTVNFVEDVGDVESLRGNEFLHELFLTGNPCTKVDYYRAFVIAALPQLRRLDGDAISKSERIQAEQAMAENRERMLADREKIEAKRAAAADAAASADDGAADKAPRKVDENGEEVFGHSPEERMRLHREMMERREASRPDDEKPRPAVPRPDVNVPDLGKDGRVLNRNEGKFDFTMRHSDNGRFLVIDVIVGRYVDTSLIDVNLQPHYIRVVSKNKVFQLTLDEEIHPDASKAERSITTGALCLKCRLVHDIVRGLTSDDLDARAAAAGKKNARGTGAQGATGASDSLTDKALDDAARDADVDYRNIVPEGAEKLVPLGSRINAHVVEAEPSADFVDDDEVPPLE